MKIFSKLTGKGIQLEFQDKRFELEFPLKEWKDFPHKELLRENLAYLATIEPAIMFKAKKIEFNSPFPLLKVFFDELFFKYFNFSSDADGKEAFFYHKELLNLEFKFKGESKFEFKEMKVKEKSLNTLTFGKESLLSFGLAKELGLNPIPLTILDRDLNVKYKDEKIKSYTNKHLLESIKKFEKEFGTKVNIIKNDLAAMRCNVIWNLEDTDLGSANVITEFILMSLPFAYENQTRYIIIGNENSCNPGYLNSSGLKCYPSFDQSAEWSKHLNALLKLITGRVQMISLVEPLQEIAVAKVLYQRYPELVKYQMSCHADNEGAKDNRWCNQCSKCARCFIFMKALGFDPASVGLKDLFGKENKKFFSLFGIEKEMCPFDLSGVGRDEQLFSFYLATKRGAKGDLIELFKQNLMEEAEQRFVELNQKFFSVYPPEYLPEHLWRRIKPIFEEELLIK